MFLFSLVQGYLSYIINEMQNLMAGDPTDM